MSLSDLLWWPRVLPVWILGVDMAPDHQAMLRWCPTYHNQKDLQLEYTTRYWGVWGEEEEEGGEEDGGKKRLAAVVSSGANL